MNSIKEVLNKISPSFCTAKWLQVTIHLQNGNTHSCHHPKTHRVSLKELQDNSSALHNTQTKKIARKEMLEGKRPAECSYCWKIEDLSGDHFSDRHIKSSDPWARPYLEEISKKSWDEDAVPTYLEVSFSNICNFQCAYCCPQDSSRWMGEVKSYGPYPTSDHFGSLLYAAKSKTLPLSEKNNPYVKAFWQWYPKISSSLHELRITGGEPLLSKDCDRLLDYLITHPSPKMVLNINSNFGISTNILEKTLKNLDFLEKSNAVKEINIYTSIDTWGTHAEYIRYGLSLDLWKLNLEKALEQLPKSRFTVMVTYNALSVFKFNELLIFIADLKSRFGSQRILIDISLLHEPSFLSVSILSNDKKKLIRQQLQQMIDMGSSFDSYEINKLKRIVGYAENATFEKFELNYRKRNFVSFIQEYDNRKGTDFIKTFPGMQTELNEWREIDGYRRFIYRIRNIILFRIEKLLSNIGRL